MTFRVPSPRRVSVVALTGSAVLALGTPAAADEDDYEQPPGYEAPAAPEIDADAAGLMLSPGASLAEARVLDIKFVTEELGGGGETETGGSAGSGGGSGEEEPDDDEEPDGESPDGGSDSGQREERSAGQHKFTLQTDVIFGEGSDEITEESREALADVAAAIDQYRPSEVNIFGFTDNQGSYDSGVTLSNRRAGNTHLVLLELIEDPSGIVFNVRGYSEDYPLYDNNTEDGRQKNRRVEISWPTEDE